MPSNHSSPGDIYRQRIVRITEAATPLEGHFNRVANARLFSALVAVASVVGGAGWSHTALVTVLWLLAAGAGAVAFVVFVAIHAGIHAKRERAKGLCRINAQAIARFERDWSKLAPPNAPAFARDNVLAGDLDLFGPGSLFHLLGTAGTAQGRYTLASWLISPPPGAAGTISARQAAVAELAGELELRQDLELAAAAHATPEQAASEDDPFLSWANSGAWLLPQRFLVWTSRLLPALQWVALVLYFTGVMSVAPLVLFFIARWMVNWRCGARVRRRLDLVCARESGLRGYGELFARLSKWEPTAPLLGERQECLRGADVAMRALDTLIGLAAMRSTPASPLAQALFMWDFHTLYLMERWQERYGARVRGWFQALGEVEALAALSTLVFDQPGWPFPVFTPEPRIVARALGHPLLSAAVRVPNDVTVGPPGTFLLVTGSNMSGKSTLLRTLGVNVVLARAGAPVCAEELRLPPGLVLATSLRVQDSLREGVSFFMAELRRLASVVEQADRTDAEPDGPVVLYLLDEVLRGTNTHERQIIVGRVVGHLLRRRAIGAVTTHDLSLAEVEGLAGAFQAVHFSEEFEEGADGAVMRFDYRMRPGLATTTNALKLLKMIGLKV